MMSSLEDALNGINAQSNIRSRSIPGITRVINDLLDDVDSLLALSNKLDASQRKDVYELVRRQLSTIKELQEIRSDLLKG